MRRGEEAWDKEKENSIKKKKVHLTFKCQVSKEAGQKGIEEWLKMIFMTYELLRAILLETGGERKEKGEAGVEMDVDAFIS